MRRGTTISKVGLITVLTLAGTAQAHDGVYRSSFDPCLYAYKPDQVRQPRFEDFPARVSAAAPKAPVIVSHYARLFRTMIRVGSKSGVNFAGHYTVVGWGCGSRCLEFALVNRASGKVIFDSALRTVATDHVDDDAPVDAKLSPDFRGLLFRGDSSLLVLEGMPNEDKKRDGVHFLRWNGRRFVEIKFIPAPKCAD